MTLPKKPRREATQEEAKALANPLRLRILRLCLDEALTNKELAARLDKDPGTLLHHVRTLVETGFLSAEPVRTGARGALEKPYRATGKSWVLSVTDRPETSDLNLAMIDAFRDEVAESQPASANLNRLGLRLRPKAARELEQRVDELIQEFADRDDPKGEPWGLFIGVHRRRVSERGG
ncbi:MAG TPA: helix-turn-helix domain-containing protein [Acidimicrobiales bacterium]|nr:helix-turn-helix domain-containing protein [Acidimicrobiales bacterium]